MAFHFDGRTVQLEAIARRADDDLVIVGLAHHGRSLFTLVQRDREFTLEAAQPGGARILAFWVADALHRAFWIQPPEDTGKTGRTGETRGTGGADGETRWEWHTEEVHETTAGAARQRSFTRRDSRNSPGREDVTIEYAAATPEDAPANGTRVEIHNPWCGYESVVVARQERLGSGAARPATEHGGAER